MMFSHPLAHSNHSQKYKILFRVFHVLDERHRCVLRNLSRGRVQNHERQQMYYTITMVNFMIYHLKHKELEIDSSDAQKPT